VNNANRAAQRRAHRSNALHLRISIARFTFSTATLRTPPRCAVGGRSAYFPPFHIAISCLFVLRCSGITRYSFCHIVAESHRATIIRLRFAAHRRKSTACSRCVAIKNGDISMADGVGKGELVAEWLTGQAMASWLLRTAAAWVVDSIVDIFMPATPSLARSDSSDLPENSSSRFFNRGRPSCVGC